MLPTTLLLAALAVPPDGAAVYDRLVRSTTLILADKGLGSGVLVHKGRRLVLTNDHVIESAAGEVQVGFAVFEPNGEPLSDFAKYKKRATAGPTLPPYVRSGRVLARRPGKDLALLMLDGVPDTARPLRLAPKHAPAGSVVFTVGNSGAGGSNQLWRYTVGNVRGRSSQTYTLGGGPRPKTLTAQVMETDAPTNPGDSGGPVANKDCQLVAVNCFGNTGGGRLVSGHIDLEEVRAFLRDAVPDIDWP